jgi:signal transduction histidine kinase
MSAVCTLDDVTDRQTLAEELSKARELELLGRLAAGIAHEINTPMQFISDNLTFLSDAFDVLVPRAGAPAAAPEDVELYQAEVPTALSDCREGVTRVSSIVRAMKAFGHPDGTNKENCDLNEIVSTTLTVARNELKYIADVRVDLDCGSDLRCFRGAIGQVVLNLLVNAAQAIAEVPGGYGTIDVRTWSDDEHAHLAVKDTGAGIAEDVAPHIFEPFFTTKPVGTGTGQGLALAWSTIVERHGGRLTCESVAGEGTTFVMSLPLVDPSPRRV